MAEDATLIPTREETASNLLRLGKCLHDYAFPPGDGIFSPRPIRFHEAERLKAEISRLEKRIESATYENDQVHLKSALGIRGREVIDTRVLRILAYVAWNTLATERPGVTVARVANVVCMEDLAGHLEARSAIRTLVNNQILRYKESDYSGGEIFIGLKILKFLNGPGHLSIYWTQQHLDDEREQLRRQQEDALTKKASQPPCKPAVLPSAHTPSGSPNLLTARGIYDSLKEQVISLEGPLRRFSAQMSLHMRRLEQIRKGVRPSVGPIVTLLIGSSSSGKSWTCECAAKSLGLPFSLADMSSISMSSFCGLDFDSCFYGLLANRTPPSLAQQGLVVLDEIDKVASHKEYSQGVGVQCEALRPLDGCRFVLGGRRSNASHMATLDTFETCFVLAGAFDGIRETLAHMQKESIGLGFGGGREKKANGDIRSLLVNYGMMSQIVHRIGSIIILPDPTPDMITRITTYPRTGLLAQRNAFLGSFGIQLLPTDEAIRHMAHWSCETKGYSRAVKTLLGTLVEEHLYDEKTGNIEVSLADVKRAIEETESSERLQK